MPGPQTRTAPLSGSSRSGSRPDPSQDAVERALVQISRFLVSSAGADLDQVLALLGDALEADSVYFVLAAETTPPHAAGAEPTPSAPSYLAGRVLSWSRDNASGQETLPLPAPSSTEASHRVCLVDGEDGRRALAVPLLAEDERFIGYLGIERAGLADPLHAPLDRILSVLGDVLGNHLSRLAAEEAREQTEQRWQSLVDRHPDPTLVVVDGAITYANNAAVHLLGADDAAALTQRPFDDFLSAADVERVHAGQAEQLQSPLPYPFEHSVVRLDGDERTVEAVCVPFPGIKNGVQQVLRDITDRKDSEERYRTFVETISEGVWRIELDTPIARSVTPRLQSDHILHNGRVAELNPTMSRMFWEQTPPINALLGDPLPSYGPSLLRAFAEANDHLLAHETAVRLDD